MKTKKTARKSKTSKKKLVRVDVRTSATCPLCDGAGCDHCDMKGWIGTLGTTK